MSNRVFKADQIKLIMECRKGGLSDYQWCEQNVSQPEIPNQGNIAAEIQVGNITLRLFNGADKHLIQNTLNALEGMNRAW